MLGCVYLLTFPSGKKYVGITRTLRLDLRLKGHKRSVGHRPVSHAVRKYWGDIDYKILRRSRSWKTLCKLEKKFIQEFNTIVPNGYNVSLGGDGAYGVKRTEEQCLKIGADSKKRWEDPDYRANIIEKSSANRTEQGKENQRIAAKKMWEDPEYREKMKKAQSLGSKRMWASRSWDHHEKYKDEI